MATQTSYVRLSFVNIVKGLRVQYFSKIVSAFQMFIKEQLLRSAIVIHVYQLRCHSIKTNIAVNQMGTPLIRPNLHGPLVTVFMGSTVITFYQGSVKLSNNFAQEVLSKVTWACSFNNSKCHVESVNEKAKEPME